MSGSGFNAKDVIKPYHCHIQVKSQNSMSGPGFNAKDVIKTFSLPYSGKVTK